MRRNLLTWLKLIKRAGSQATARTKDLRINELTEEGSECSLLRDLIRPHLVADLAACQPMRFKKPQLQ